MLLGLAGPLAGQFNNPVCHGLNVALSGGWPWACLAFLIGYSRSSRIESTLLAALSLLVAVTVYYVFKTLNPAPPIGMTLPDGAMPTSTQNLASGVIVWGAAAFILCGPVGFLGNLAREPFLRGMTFRLIIPLIAFVETSMRISVEADAAGSAVSITWQAIRALAVITAMLLVVQAVMEQRRRRNTRTPGNVAS
ncbi:hypothetical protein [Streptomyces goshikiensis]|uniref:hypothetical protein n=1 Tax=Streptomyces goshikiensis TaxID=1942 RepID=UPI00367DA1DB